MHSPATYVIDVPRLPRSGNKQRRTHWAQNRKEKLLFEDALWLLAKAHKVPRTGTYTDALGRTHTEPQERRTVQVEFIKTRRGGTQDDRPNLHERTKSVLDAMKACGLIVDDSDRWIEYLNPTERRPRQSEQEKRTIITLTTGDHSA